MLITSLRKSPYTTSLKRSATQSKNARDLQNNMQHISNFFDQLLIKPVNSPFFYREYWPRRPVIYVSKYEQFRNLKQMMYSRMAEKDA